TVMSDSDESTVTYTEVALQAPPLLDYIPGPEEPQSPPPPDFIPEPVYPEYMSQEEEVFPAEEQPLPAAASPTAQSPDYVPESDPKEDLEEDDDEDPEEDPVDYLADGGDDGDDEDESSKDDEDDDVDIKADDDEEEEEHPAPADSTTVALPAADQAPSAEETEPFETDESTTTPPPHPAYRVTARISIPAPVPTPVWSDAEVAKLLAISTPPSSPLSPWSSPLTHIPFPPLPPIPSPSLPLSPPLPVSAPPPASLIRLLGYRAAMIRLRAEATSTSHSLLLPPLSPIPAPTSSPPLLLPFTNYREDRPEVTLPPRKRLGIALGPTCEVRESSSAAVARLAGDDMVEDLQGTPVVIEVAELSQRMIEFETRVRQDTDEVYTRLDDEQTRRQLLAGRLNMLFRDRRTHARTARLMKTEARISREAWGRSIDETEEVHRGTKADEETTDSDGRAMIDQDVTAVLAARDANTNGIDSHNSGTGTEGVVELTQWIEKMETVFRISNCSLENQIKFSTCTLLGNALTWWNSHVRTVGNDVAYAMTWKELKKKMTHMYCPMTEIKKLKVELWDLKVKGNDVIGYNQCFQELALLCVRMFLEESDKIERYVGGLPDMIYGSVVVSKPKIMQEAT
ncbi:putative reverse transcriptase domain-containing protein, partial [Tanacetum coccineum]